MVDEAWLRSKGKRGSVEQIGKNQDLGINGKRVAYYRSTVALVRVLVYPAMYFGAMNRYCSTQICCFTRSWNRLQESRGRLQESRSRLQESRNRLQESRGRLQESRSRLQELWSRLQKLWSHLQEPWSRLQQYQNCFL